MALYEFLLVHREEVLRDAGHLIRVIRPQMPGLDAARDENLPAFLDAVIEGLRRRENLPPDPVPLPQRTGAPRAHDRWKDYDVDEVVHEYGALCTTIIRAAENHGQAISSSQHQALNQALDENIAADIVAYDLRRRDASRHRSAERLGFVAHELRNALHTAALSFQAIRAGHVTAQGAAGGLVERSHHVLRALVERLVAQVRLGSGTLIRRELLALAPLAREAVAFVGGDAKEKGVHVEIDVDDGLAACADRMLLTSALTNLAQNAVKFTPAGGSVRVRGIGLGGRVRVDVEDGCGGLDPAIQELMFAAFVQGRQQHGGMGLGLTIAREILVAHGGTLSVRDLPGRGCVFSMDLPAWEPSPAERD